MATVKDILSKKGASVITLVASDSVLDAARIMNTEGIGGLVVTDGGVMVGIFTERDILRRVVSEQRDPGTTQLRDVMTSPVVYCPSDAKLEELTALMTEKRIRHLPVMDEGELCGIVTTGDLLAFEVKEQAYTIEHLHKYVYDIR
jgi:CBS domain-containing protein